MVRVQVEETKSVDNEPVEVEFEDFNIYDS